MCSILTSHLPACTGQLFVYVISWALTLVTLVTMSCVAVLCTLEYMRRIPHYNGKWTTVIAGVSCASGLASVMLFSQVPSVTPGYEFRGDEK